MARKVIFAKHALFVVLRCNRSQATGFERNYLISYL